MSFLVPGTHPPGLHITFTAVSPQAPLAVTVPLTHLVLNDLGSFADCWSDVSWNVPLLEFVLFLSHDKIVITPLGGETTEVK